MMHRQHRGKDGDYHVLTVSDPRPAGAMKRRAGSLSRPSIDLPGPCLGSACYGSVPLRMCWRAIPLAPDMAMYG